MNLLNCPLSSSNSTITCGQNSRLLIDLLLATVAPEDHTRAKYEIQGCSHFRVLYYVRHFQTIQSHLSYVVSSGKEQTSVTICCFTTSMIPGIFKVTRGTAALEATLFVQAKLGTAARSQAFVYVWKKKGQDFVPITRIIVPQQCSYPKIPGSNLAKPF